MLCFDRAKISLLCNVVFVVFFFSGGRASSYCSHKIEDHNLISLHASCNLLNDSKKYEKDCSSGGLMSGSLEPCKLVSWMYSLSSCYFLEWMNEWMRMVPIKALESVVCLPYLSSSFLFPCSVSNTSVVVQFDHFCD